MVLPGLIELHTDNLERHLKPRPGVRWPGPEAVVAHDGDIVTVPEGYHPVSAAYGYDCYYLNFLAGSAQSLACADDPDHDWVKGTWTGRDSRVPMVTHAMEPGESR